MARYTTCKEMTKMGDDEPGKTRTSDDYPFGVIEGGRGDEENRPAPVHTEISYDGVKMVLRGRTEVWALEDPGAWVETPLSEMPAMVAYVTLGLGKPHGMLTPGQAARVIGEAFERVGELTTRRERALARIPEDSSGFENPDLPTTASLEFWWMRWWPGLA